MSDPTTEPPPRRSPRHSGGDTHPDTFVTPESRRGFDRVAGACRLMRFGGDCYSYCLLALGCIDLIVEDSLKPFDIIPLIPILEGAGAVVTDGRGRHHRGSVGRAASSP